MRRLGLLLMVAMVSLALSQGPAWAGAPDRVPFESEDGLLPVGPCTFPVFIHVVENNEYTIKFFDDAGNLIRTIIQGRAVLEFTNMDTGTSVIRNLSGPGTITEADQIFVARGPWLFLFFPGDLGPEEPGSMYINYGRVVEFLGEPPETPPQIISQTGVQEDLCATLSTAPESEAPGAAVSESSAVEISSEAETSQGPALEPVLGAAMTERSDGEALDAETDEYQQVRPPQGPTYAFSE